MDLPAFAAQLLGQSEQLLCTWLSNGKKVGDEWTVGSLANEPGQSCKTNLKTGIGADFSTGQSWGDLIALYAAIHGLGQFEAAKRLGYDNGTLVPITTPTPSPAQTSKCEPIPADAPVIPGPVPMHTYAYGDKFVIARYENEDGTKTFKPWTWRTVNGSGKWVAKAYPAPRPLFGLELLDPTKPTLVVEGEKACLAARTLLGQHFTVVTWAGGANAVDKSDWAPLYGMAVDLWPDADKAGAEAVRKVAEILAPHSAGARLRVLLQDGQSEGWDAADALADGLTGTDVINHIKREGGKYIKVIGTPGGSVEIIPTTHKGRIRDGKPPIESPDNAPSVHTQWESMGLQGNSGGIPYPTEANAIAILSSHPIFAGKIWLDEFAQELMWESDQFERTRAVEALVYMQKSLDFHKMALQTVERAALVVGANNKRHPVRDWLNSLTWDGQSRLDELMPAGFGSMTDIYTQAVGRCWLVSMVARVFEPGCQADCMPVFEGSQGILKSSAMRVLGGQWFAESHKNPIKDGKDWFIGLRGHWLIELPEMHQIAGRGGSGIAQIKGIVTNRVDHYREPYGVTVRAYPRQCIFAGTTNEDSWNPDATGGRRFWPISCGTIELGWIRDNREQLFAEALALYRQTHIWWDVPETEAREEQEARRERDAWEEPIMGYLASRPGHDITIADILDSCLQKDMGQWTQADQNRVAKTLRANGYLKIRLRSDGVRSWAYRKSATLTKSLLPREPVREPGEDDAVGDF